jgi:hypothetical protein
LSYWEKARQLDTGRDTARNAPINGIPAWSDGGVLGGGVGLDLAAGRSSARSAGSQSYSSSVAVRSPGIHM